MRRRRMHRPVRHALGAVLVCAALTVPALTPTAAPAAGAAAPADAPVRYVHDALGRLVTVMNPTGQVARYTYDAAGNILSITRSTAAARSVVDLSPRSVSPGGQLSIIGRGFSANASDNVVKLNGTVAPVVSATPTELVVTVPGGATSGPVTVTTPGGTATGASLTVHASQKPTITGHHAGRRQARAPDHDRRHQLPHRQPGDLGGRQLDPRRRDLGDPHPHHRHGAQLRDLGPRHRGYAVRAGHLRRGPQRRPGTDPARRHRRDQPGHGRQRHAVRGRHRRAGRAAALRRPRPASG